MEEEQQKIVYDIGYHVYWFTKYNRPLLSEEMEKEISDIIDTIAKENGADIYTHRLTSNFVELSIYNLHPKISIHKIIQRIKDRSASLLKKKYKELNSRTSSIWTKSYYCETLGTFTKKITLKEFTDIHKKM